MRFLTDLLHKFLEQLKSTESLLEHSQDSTDALIRVLELFNELSPEFSASLNDSKGLPLIRRGRTLGHLEFQGDVPELLEDVLRREVTFLLERTDRQRRKEIELKRLNKAGSAVNSPMDLQSTLKVILRTALEVTDARYGIFRLLDNTGDLLETAAVAGEDLDRPMVKALQLDGSHITGQVAKQLTSLRIDDLRERPWCESYVPLDLELEMRSELAVPLLGNGNRLEGVLNLESPSVGAFTHGDQLLLEAFAAQAVVAIQQARLLDALLEVSESVLERPHSDVLLRIVELTSLLLNSKGVELEYQDGVIRKGTPEGEKLEVPLDPSGRLCAYLAAPADWESKALACLAHHAELTLRNKSRLDELRATQQKQALTETFAAVGDLSANLLHQLNNKIGIIPVRIEGILAKCSDAVQESAYLQRNLNEIESGAQRALEIVRQNLSILRPRPVGMVNLSQCLKRAVKELALEDIVSDELEVPQVQGDVRSFTLVFHNLLENAARALRGNGKIWIVGKSEGKRLVIRVIDDGPGIPLEQQKTVFQLNQDQSRPHNLGFGLWWVRTVMERCGGGISLESDGKSGTTFRLEFPLP